MQQSLDSQFRQLETVHILGVRIHTLPLERLLDLVTQAILARRRTQIMYVNVHALNLAYHLPWFRRCFNEANLVFCDGFGVKWGAWLLGVHLPYRYTPPDWFPSLCQICIQHDFSLFFLGARPGVANAAAAHLQNMFPSIRIAGVHHGYFDKTPGGGENTAVIDAINSAKPDILVLGFGMPMQERWLIEAWDQLQTPVVLTVGAMFDYISGQVPRGPRWMTDHGLEWLSRLVVEPQRLWQRYLIGNPLFLGRVLKQRIGLLHFDE